MTALAGCAGPLPEPYWFAVSKADPRARALADRHYSRQKIGSRELGPPGQKLVFLGRDGRAVWGSHRPAPWAGIKRMDGFEGHSCFLFRNEGQEVSSALIREAVGLTARVWGVAPFITYVAIEKVKGPHPGYCYLRAGFHKCAVRNGTKLGKMLRMEMAADEVGRCLKEVLL